MDNYFGKAAQAATNNTTVRTWPSVPAALEEAEPKRPLRRLLADVPDEYRKEPIGVIEAEVRRVLVPPEGDLADSPG